MGNGMENREKGWDPLGWNHSAQCKRKPVGWALQMHMTPATGSALDEAGGNLVCCLLLLPRMLGDLVF